MAHILPAMTPLSWKTQHDFNGCLLFCRRCADTKEHRLVAVCDCSLALCPSLSFCHISLPSLLSTLLPTHCLSRTHTSIGTAEYHTLLANYLLQTRRGGLRWRLPQPSLIIVLSFSRSLSVVSVKGHAAFS